MRKLISLIAAVFAAIIGIPLLGGAAIFGGGGTSCVPTITAPASAASAVPVPVASSGAAIPTLDGWDAEQLGIVATILTVGKSIPSWGWVVAVATGMQESNLRNLAGGADDSIGVFQQRPSQGWGTPQQLRDPAYQAAKFFDKLTTVEGWQQMPLTEAAQAVQVSAYPDAYAKHTAGAIRLVSHVGAALGLETLGDLGQCVSSCPSVTTADSGTCLDAATVFGRARSWLTAWAGGPVPYLSSGDPADWYQGYRRDCSGYVSMALGLDGPGLNTAGLAAHSAAISKADLLPGDLLINPAPNLRGHVVLFERWADSSMSSYWGYEQSGDGGTHYRQIPYPYFGTYSMAPYRFLN